MPTSYKGTLYFLCGNQGWSESFIKQQTDPAGDLSPLQTDVENLAASRRGFLSKDAVITHISVREIGTEHKGRVALKEYGQKGNFAEAGADPDGAMILRLYSAGKLSFSLRPFRGLPQSAYNPNDTDAPWPGGFPGAVSSFVKQLTNGNWGWLKRSLGVSNAIAAITGGAGSPAVVQTAGTPFAAMSAGDHVSVRIKSVEGATQLNGGFVGLVVDPNHVRIPKVTAFGPYTTGTGFLRAYGTPTLRTIQDWDFEVDSERKTGRPFGQQRGRRPARRSL